jgi:hypothetical protein
MRNGEEESARPSVVGITHLAPDTVHMYDDNKRGTSLLSKRGLA